MAFPTKRRMLMVTEPQTMLTMMMTTMASLMMKRSLTPMGMALLTLKTLTMIMTEFLTRRIRTTTMMESQIHMI